MKLVNDLIKSKQDELPRLLNEIGMEEDRYFGAEAARESLIRESSIKSSTNEYQNQYQNQNQNQNQPPEQRKRGSSLL